jgi:hypothetical protein
MAAIGKADRTCRQDLPTGLADMTRPGAIDAHRWPILTLPKPICRSFADIKNTPWCGLTIAIA